MLNLSKIMHFQPPTYERKKHYEFGRDLGTGTYGTVKQARSLDTGKDVAVKVILKKTVKGHEDMVDKEMEVLKNLNHPHIVNFLDWFESRDKYYLVFDLASGGELFDKICEQGRFTENNAATIMKEVIQAIEYLHSKNVVHRDLKPENLLYADNTPNSKLMIVDFGISKEMDSEDQVLMTMCGSYGYAAPEVLLRKGHGKPVDMWSIGIITYTLLCGYAPFQAENDHQLVAEIARCNVVFHQRYWKDVSIEARDFIKSLLKADPSKRLTATEALQHKWITTETGTDVDLLDNVKEGFNAKRMFKKTVRAVAAANRLRTLTRNSTMASTLSSTSTTSEMHTAPTTPLDSTSPGSTSSYPTGPAVSPAEAAAALKSIHAQDASLSSSSSSTSSAATGHEGNPLAGSSSATATTTTNTATTTTTTTKPMAATSSHAVSPAEAAAAVRAMSG